MYKQFFSLKQSPFSIAPDPRYLFMSERHREALAHLLYGVNSGGGFVLLTGEIGAGKTTVCRCFIEQIPPGCRLAYIFNPKLTVEELLLSICDEFRIDLPPAPAGAVSVKSYVDAINRYLLLSHAQGKNNVLIIDEAQNLSADVLEQLRLLTNLETSERKLLQIILIGQPELRAILARPELEQLAQRVIARYHLGSLTEAETASYVAHRLAVAGGGASRPFPRSLMGQVFQLSQGVPRRINLLCDRALLGAYVENSREVTRQILRRAGSEVFSGGANAPASRMPWQYVAAGVLATAAIGAAAAWQFRPAARPVLVQAAPAPAPVKAVAAVAPPAPVAPLPRAPAVPLTHASEAAALHALSALWGVALPAGATCDDALKLNLRCHQGKGGLYELRLLDRPAVLTLRDGPVVSYALLTGMDESSVRLNVDGKEQTLDLGALATRSDGSFVTFWAMPRYFRDQVSAGEQGADVDWIASRLAKVNGLAPPPADRPMGAPTLELLRAFQARQNLKADGVAGPRTYMRLNQLTGVAEPRLLAAGATGKP
ncbi:AAA family ATPase [Massilia violaceinigra]|uniref:AAA family ATPase n=1 Tax=Massilia violaceinigra TaxID=2045208 RepID=A0ABY3ZZ74_9BURK|nr:ExeA family protein [Massilia violaceinigra]UOD27703.1 AAA family ATPase [Massilia violaceinigra]